MEREGIRDPGEGSRPQREEGLTTESIAHPQERQDRQDRQDRQGAQAESQGRRPPVYPGESTGATGQQQEPVDDPEYVGEERAGGPEEAPPGSGIARHANEEDRALLGPDETDEYRGKWRDIQSTFVDDPRDAVRSADALVADVMQTLARSFAAHKQDLEVQWDRGEEVATEELRVALTHYRSFFNRLLST
ncbi:hypothetical protein ACFO9E_27070 [Streptomyces maoxianensis]|uniref:Uncharacterized protein n=1 Tax=Streptomyces maoxianensis TaxID=1459942 RepID=A0ABV9GAV1_9ACTN